MERKKDFLKGDRVGEDVSKEYRTKIKLIPGYRGRHPRTGICEQCESDNNLCKSLVKIFYVYNFSTLVCEVYLTLMLRNAANSREDKSLPQKMVAEEWESKDC